MGLLFGCSTIVVAFSLISLAFLIIATITPPAVTAFGLAEADDYLFGALGYCSSDGTNCVTGNPSYTVSTLTESTNWVMDDSARDTLAKILIVLPVAAFLTLVTFLLNLVSHFKVFGGSLAFYVVAFIFTLLAFIGSAIAAIITFLCFYPYVKWPAYLLIPAAALNLVSVPLVFFALRTNPRSSDDIDEMDEMMAETNLTDLSDGDHFQRAPSFRLNNIPSTTDTFEKFGPSSTLKVITDDSASSNDQYEKVSIKDYSRSHNNNNNVPTYNGYKGYDLNITPPPTDSEGTPNLVSSQNYNKGVVRSEAPEFQPESVRPDFGTAPYPSAQYNSSKDQLSQPNSGVLGKSNHDDSNLSTSDPYDDNEDSHSDFTSVSQRAANPRYLSGLQQQGPSLFPQQQGPPPQQVQPQNSNQGYISQSQSGYFPQNSNNQSYSAQPPQQYNNNYQQGGFQQDYQHGGYQQQGGYQQGGYQEIGYQQQGGYQQSYPKPIQRDTSAQLLNANPDFAVSGPAFQKQNFAKKPNPAAAGGYRPAYKRLQTGSGNKVSAASLSNDSPYNFR